MLKVLLYGLATFMETGIGVWIFSQTFSERRILEKKYYVLEWLLYSLIFFGIYNFSVSLWQIDKKIEKYVIKVICIYIIGLIAGIIYDIFFCKEKGDGLKKNIIYRHDILVNCPVLGWISIVVNDYSWEWNNCIICFLLL